MSQQHSMTYYVLGEGPTLAEPGDLGRVLMVLVNRGDADARHILTGLDASRLEHCRTSVTDSVVRLANIQVDRGSATITIPARSAVTLIESTPTAHGPTVTVKDGHGFTIGAPDAYKKVSYKLFSPHQVDRFTMNGVPRDLVKNPWSDINHIRAGRFGAVAGENTLIVFDANGHSTTVTFNLATPEGTSA